MGFGQLFGKSWKEYKSNFSSIFKIMLVFYAIPMIILFILTSWWFVHSGLAGQIVSGYENLNLMNGNVSSLLSSSQGINFYSLQQSMGKSFSFSVILVYVLIILIFTLITYFSYVAMSATSLKKEKFSFSELIRNGRENYWRSIGFWIVLAIFLGLLFLALFIPGAIFVVFWVFSYFVFLDEKKGIIHSLKRSFNIVRGRWWKTLGYIVLLGLILIGISIIFGIPSSIIQLILLFAVSNGGLSVGTLVFASLVKQVFNIALSFVTVPLMILFIKNFYLSAKNRK